MNQSHQAILTAQRKAGPGSGTDVDELPGDVCEYIPGVRLRLQAVPTGGCDPVCQRG